MAKKKVPTGLIGKTVAEAKDALPSGLELRLCKSSSQPTPWFKNLEANKDKKVDGYHEETQPGVELVVPGTVGVVVPGIIEPRPPGGSDSSARVVINITIVVGEDGSVTVTT